jgi:hypothetical protein
MTADQSTELTLQNRSQRAGRRGSQIWLHFITSLSDMHAIFPKYCIFRPLTERKRFGQQTPQPGGPKSSAAGAGNRWRGSSTLLTEPST